MKNLLEHPHEEIRNAAVRLLDALTQHERACGREYLVIIKVDHPGEEYGYRTLSGGPVSERDTDEQLLEAFESVTKR